MNPDNTLTENSCRLHGINKNNLDESVNPKQDFYHYAAGGWMKANPLLPEYTRFSTFDKLRENSKYQLRDLIQNLSEDPEAKIKGTIAQKISDLYNMAMDTERLNKEGALPVKWIIDRINDASENDINRLISFIQYGITSVFFSASVGPDPQNSDMNIMHIGETGLGLGDRDYYLEKNETNDRILEAYEKYVKRNMELIGYGPEEQQRVWETVIETETEFARHKKSREERRNPQLSFNPMTMEEIRSRYSVIDWVNYFKDRKIESLSGANVTSPAFLDFINQYLPKMTLQQIKDFMVYNAVTDSANLLSEDFQKASFELFGKVMSGQEEMKPLWKRAMTVPTSMFGEAVGQLYVKKYFSEDNKIYMSGLVENLRHSLAKHITALEWMSDDTKEKALDKLAAMKVKIGYPDKWKDYSGIIIDPEKTYLENVYKAALWFIDDNFQKLGKSVDKDEWFMFPQTVNAYYSPSMNEICFPAGILQPPYFDPKADDAVNYGAIGVVIGHEMTHGFDDQGRQFDKNGNLCNWWHEDDEKNFNILADRLVELFNQVEVAPGVFANGRFTLGENIADQGGLRVAMTAYKDSRTDREDDCVDDGFSDMQRFYLSYGNVWACNIRDEEVLECTKSDPHSLSVNRVNETLKNIEPFFEAFDIKEGDAMFRKPEERVTIW